MTARVLVPPINRRMMTPQGFVAPEWRVFFEQVSTALGGVRGPGDAVAATAVAAREAQAVSGAVAAGVDTALLTPSFPLASAPSGPLGLGSIIVYAHTRAGAGAQLASGTVNNLAQGRTYHVYYVDGANAGGVQTYLASTSQADAVGTGKRYIGAIAIPTPSGGFTPEPEYEGID